MGKGITRRRILETIGTGLASTLAGCSQDSGSRTTNTPERISGSWTTFQHDAANLGRDADAQLPDDPRVEWRYETGTDAVSSAVVADSVVYGWNGAGHVFSLDAATGEENWTSESVGETILLDSPLLDGNTLYVPGGEGLVALDASDGTIQWTADATGSTPAKAGDLLFVAGMDAIAVDAKDGSEVWTNEDVMAVMAAPPAVVGETVYISATESLFALDAETGSIDWDFDGGFTDDIADLTAPMVVDGTVYIAAQVGVPEKVYGVDMASGEEVWSELLGRHRAVPVGALATLGEYLVGVEEFGTVFSIPAGGAGGWYYQMNNGVDVNAGAPPVVAGDEIVVTTSAGTAAFDAEGERLWYREEGGTYGAPAVVDDWVFVPDGEGTLHALH